MPFMKDRLKSRRVDMGLTLQEVADAIGVEKPTVQRYESGKIKKIDTITVEMLAKAVRCDPAYLMGWSEAPCAFSKVKVSSDTECLVDNYKALNDEGRRKLLDYSKDLISGGRYAARNEDAG